ncbi:serine/threonine protein kinase, partial [Macromonas nakdongensis]|uniref:serine/threonine protein kinase n=1 Tax=Macromonas nakdongensis TaxID=1843082 RepID=UPI000C31C6E1
MTAAHPYDALTPNTVLDALAHLGLWGDGRLMALSSYENRVYLAHLDDGDAVVLKFYRPGRWSDAQIEEEHRFAQDLVVAEVPVVAPRVLHDRTLHHHAGFAFSVSPRRGGRRPELDDPEVLEWIGRFLARLHNTGAQAPFVQRPALDATTFGHDALDWLQAHDAVPPAARSGWLATARAALDAAAQALAATRTSPETAGVVAEHTLTLDGQAGTDSYFIHTTGSNGVDNRN